MTLKEQYGWIQEPLIACAPMRLISLEELATSVTVAGGLGFIGAGSDTVGMGDTLQAAQKMLKAAGLYDSQSRCLPVGIGFLNWGANLTHATQLVAKFRPCAVWFFAARSSTQMQDWTVSMRKASPQTQIWIQVSTVKDAIDTVNECQPDVLVVQGTDAGGHGLTQAGASLMTLLPEVVDNLASHCKDKKIKLVAAGGITDGRGIAAALTLGADGVVMGTRFLAAPEAVLAQGYRQAVLDESDGGITTVRTDVYDQLRGTTNWPQGYGGRGIINQSYADAQAGMSVSNNKQLYETALQQGDKGWGREGRLTTYAGTGIGLIHQIMPASDIVKSVRTEAIRLLQMKAKAVTELEKAKL